MLKFLDLLAQRLVCCKGDPSAGRKILDKVLLPNGPPRTIVQNQQGVRLIVRKL